MGYSLEYNASVFTSSLVVYQVFLMPLKFLYKSSHTMLYETWEKKVRRRQNMLEILGNR